MNYCHYNSIHDFLDAMVSTAEAAILEAARSSPGKAYVLMTDESTDNFQLSTLMTYIRFVDSSTGLVRNYFLSVTSLKGCNAQSTFDACVTVLKAKDLNSVDIISLGTDGATVMTGQKMLQNHCMSHRLALASEKAATPIPYLNKVIETLNGLHRMFHDPPPQGSGC